MVRSAPRQHSTDARNDGHFGECSNLDCVYLFTAPHFSTERVDLRHVPLSSKDAIFLYTIKPPTFFLLALKMVNNLCC